MTVKLPYIDRFTDRNEHERLYFRRPGGKRIPLPAADDPGFMAAYNAAAETQQAPKAIKHRGAAGTFDRLCGEYYASPEFLALKASSRAVSRGILEAFCREHGHRPVAGMERKHVQAIIGRKASTPAAANNLLKKLRVLIGFGIANDYRTDDPTIRMKRFKEGTHHTWDETEIAAFEARWPLSSRERTAFALALYTGQRRGDLARMTWRAYDEAAGTIDVAQEKTGARLSIPVHRDLRSTLAAWPRSALMIMVTSFARPFSVAGFGNFMADSIDAAGLPRRCVLHGLRKAAARRLAEAGCTAHEIMAVTGHKSLSEVQRYTEAVEQKSLAGAAVHRLEERFGNLGSQPGPRKFPTRRPTNGDR